MLVYIEGLFLAIWYMYERGGPESMLYMLVICTSKEIIKLAPGTAGPAAVNSTCSSSSTGQPVQTLLGK